ncbi:tetratricopeptide repeat protein [Methanochimaera problematica]|uniref:tetratricopeptide repeat protein n=1 Tax=Methanochimaera problematica TaxID=2609417 RepID=UPI002938E676|nr:tetratricopeptide repeat protein [Methanoplanus sp. FWC-SCC4]
MNFKNRFLFITGILIAAVFLSAGCTDRIPALDGKIITDDNPTHQKWLSEYLNNPEKYKKDPENPLEWTLKGMSSAALPDGHKEALLHYDKAIELDPGFAHAYYAKAVSLLNLKRFNEAEKCLQKAIEINSQYEPLAEDLKINYIGKR